MQTAFSKRGMVVAARPGMIKELSEQVHLAGVRAVVLADGFPFSEAETGVCMHVDALDTVSTHSKSYGSLPPQRGGVEEHLVADYGFNL